MPNRILKETIRTSRSVNALSDFQFRVWTYLITYVDDFGRGSADPQLLKGLCFPRRSGITENQLAKALSDLANTGMITLYEVDGESFFYFPNWEKHQQLRAKKSKFPEPASICNQMISDDSKCSRNPIQYESESESEKKPKEARKARTVFVPPTVEEVAAYCQQRNNGIDPEAFVAFYRSKNWKIGKDPMTDWKSAVITWEKRRKEDANRGTRNTCSPAADSPSEGKSWNIHYDND